ncbi:hypothetical protein [Micromonospora sp. HM5-17]|uniref:aa3-type cytochrome oxidase subunit CtaJ n=1 Tax=Micromonospora sp. HM5-17 TaxID=2487710 RepID=UPI000F479598|nr:hypothetical protein [Micromonospora sp. HM5-17]ROT26309.1 hypothetical protein EF879_25470 [Micromonospora sp. HM5-17]
MLIFVAIPLAAVLVITVLARIGRGSGAGSKRYRPGRPFTFTPVWFLSSPKHLTDAARTALPEGAEARALTSGEIETISAPKRAGVTGGASDRW